MKNKILNHISVVYVLENAKFHELKKLFLGYNKILDLNGLFKAKFKNLYTLDLYRNKFDGAQITFLIIKIFPKLNNLLY